MHSTPISTSGTLGGLVFEKKTEITPIFIGVANLPDTIPDQDIIISIGHYEYSAFEWLWHCVGLAHTISVQVDFPDKEKLCGMRKILTAALAELEQANTTNSNRKNVSANDVRRVH